jgi:hypothetical protein
MLPKGAYGLIQCKQRYSTQEEMLAVAKGYRDRHLPIDILELIGFITPGSMTSSKRRGGSGGDESPASCHEH